jgi:hypothetical protein
MSTSITGSTNTPFNAPLVTDSNFMVSASWAAGGGVTPSWAFANATNWPTIANFQVYVYSTILTGNTGSNSLYVQESSDNVNWSNCANIAAPLLAPTASAAVSTYLTLQPASKQYFRVSCSIGAGNGTPAGTFGATLYI